MYAIPWPQRCHAERWTEEHATAVEILVERGASTAGRLHAPADLSAVAYALPPAPNVHAPKQRGRPRRYGDKIQVASLLVDDGAMSHGRTVPASVLGQDAEDGVVAKGGRCHRPPYSKTGAL